MSFISLIYVILAKVKQIIQPFINQYGSPITNNAFDEDSELQYRYGLRK